MRVTNHVSHAMVKVFSYIYVMVANSRATKKNSNFILYLSRNIPFGVANFIGVGPMWAKGIEIMGALILHDT